MTSGQRLFQQLLNLKNRLVKLKIVSDPESKTLAPFFSCFSPGAEVRFVNMTALTKGHIHSSFWLVDRKHIYIGSGSMTWKSLATRKELGVIVYNCSCLALDLHRIFSFFWQLQHKDYIPSIWSKRVTALYSKDEPLLVHLNSSDAVVYVSSSPDLFCAKDRTRDIDAIQRVILEAKKFIYVSVTNYLPLVWKTSNGQQYWSIIDEALREALVLRRVRVYLLISLWKKTHPLTYNFVTSLKSLCLGLENCSLDVVSDILANVNNNKYIIKPNHFLSATIGIFIVTRKLEGRPTILDQVKAAFERDWFSHDAKRLQDLILSGRTAGNPGLHPVKSEIRSKDRKVMRSMSL
uniref:PLD phosphodiesterase domain-containing protein n=1 Tax=Denticeps clupeoides TaxID=299321 RepID=A0AAY4EWG6_9TELE